MFVVDLRCGWQAGMTCSYCLGLLRSSTTASACLARETIASQHALREGGSMMSRFALPPPFFSGSRTVILRHVVRASGRLDSAMLDSRSGGLCQWFLGGSFSPPRSAEEP